MSETPSSDVVFEDPPKPRKRNGRYDWVTIGAKLRKKPGEWAKIADRDRASIAMAIKQSSISTFLPAHGYEVKTANNEKPPGKPQTCSLYVRYVPEQDTTLKPAARKTTTKKGR